MENSKHQVNNSFLKGDFVFHSVICSRNYESMGIVQIITFGLLTILFFIIQFKYYEKRNNFPIRGHGPILVMAQATWYWLSSFYNFAWNLAGFIPEIRDSEPESIEHVEYQVNFIARALMTIILVTYIHRMVFIWVFMKGQDHIKRKQKKGEELLNEINGQINCCSKFFKKLRYSWIIKTLQFLISQKKYVVVRFFMCIAIHLIVAIIQLFGIDFTKVSGVKVDVQFIFCEYFIVFILWLQTNFYTRGFLLCNETKYLFFALVVKLAAALYFFPPSGESSCKYILQLRLLKLYYIICYILIVQCRAIYYSKKSFERPPSIVQKRLDLVILNPYTFVCFEKFIRESNNETYKDNLKQLQEFFDICHNDQRKKLFGMIALIDQEINKNRNQKETIYDPFQRLFVDSYLKDFDCSDFKTTYIPFTVPPNKKNSTKESIDLPERKNENLMDINNMHQETFPHNNTGSHLTFNQNNMKLRESWQQTSGLGQFPDSTSLNKKDHLSNPFERTASFPSNLPSIDSTKQLTTESNLFLERSGYVTAKFDNASFIQEEDSSDQTQTEQIKFDSQKKNISTNTVNLGKLPANKYSNLQQEDLYKFSQEKNTSKVNYNQTKTVLSEDKINEQIEGIKFSSFDNNSNNLMINSNFKSVINQPNFKSKKDSNHCDLSLINNMTIFIESTKKSNNMIDYNENNTPKHKYSDEENPKGFFNYIKRKMTTKEQIDITKKNPYIFEKDTLENNSKQPASKLPSMENHTLENNFGSRNDDPLLRKDTLTEVSAEYNLHISENDNVQQTSHKNTVIINNPSNISKYVITENQSTNQYYVAFNDDFKQIDGQEYYNSFLDIHCEIRINKEKNTFKMINIGQRFDPGTCLQICKDFNSFAQKNKYTRIEIAEVNLIGKNIAKSFMTKDGIIVIDDIELLCFHPELKNAIKVKDFKNRLIIWNKLFNKFHSFYNHQITEELANDLEIIKISMTYYLIQKLENAYNDFIKTKAYNLLKMDLKRFEYVLARTYAISTSNFIK